MPMGFAALYPSYGAFLNPCSRKIAAAAGVRSQCTNAAACGCALAFTFATGYPIGGSELSGYVASTVHRRPPSPSLPETPPSGVSARAPRRRAERTLSTVPGRGERLDRTPSGHGQGGRRG